jgi:lycopene beta-cyclase
METDDHDTDHTKAHVVVIGAGPAGLSLATACAKQGLSTTVVSPDPERRWERSFGLWADELDGLAERDAISHTWASPVVHTDDPTRYEIQRRYARLDVGLLQNGMGRRAREAGVRFVDDHVKNLVHDTGGTRVGTRQGHVLDASVVADASGFGSPFVETIGRDTPAWQTAFGRLVRVQSHPWPRGEMVFMDFRSARSSETPTPPTFLYAMPLSAQLVFVEETSLTARPGLSMDELASRLDARLDRMGIKVLEVLEEERCRIAMGGPLPKLDQRVVGFGAAASMVHPASGYMLARVLRTAPAVAEGIATGLALGGPQMAAQSGWKAVWTRDALRNHELFRFGMETLCRLDVDRTRALFDTFFRLPRNAWQGFLSDGLSPEAVARTMLTVFADAEPSLRWPLVNTGLGRPGVSVFRSLVGL